MMNERIKELYLHAFPPSLNDSTTVQMSAKKFAELIVRECAKVLDDKLANPNGANMAYCDGSDLLEHFGVEE